MPEKGNTLSRNPNVCASCSSMVDGMEQSNVPETPAISTELAKAAAPDLPENKPAPAIQLPVQP